MKNIFLMGLLAIALFVTSCEKSSQYDSNVVDTVDDQSLNAVAANNAEANDAVNELENLQEELLEARESTTCPTITSTAPKGSFPNVITIDFGTGCIDKKGRFHSGKMVIEQSDSLNNQGAVRKTTFVNFGMDSVRVKNGIMTLTNESVNPEGNKRFIRKSSGLTISSPKGTLEIQSIHARIQLAGGMTKDRSDDKWKIEGETNGTVNGNLKFSAIIKEPLVIKGDCPFIVNGKEEINRNGKKMVIEYGDGTCDRFARAMKENGDVMVIVLRPRFH